MYIEYQPSKTFPLFSGAFGHLEEQAVLVVFEPWIFALHDDAQQLIGQTVQNDDEVHLGRRPQPQAAMWLR